MTQEEQNEICAFKHQKDVFMPLNEKIDNLKKWVVGILSTITIAILIPSGVYIVGIDKSTTSNGAKLDLILQQQGQHADNNDKETEMEKLAKNKEK